MLSIPCPRLLVLGLLAATCAQGAEPGESGLTNQALELGS